MFWLGFGLLVTGIGMALLFAGPRQRDEREIRQRFGIGKEDAKAPTEKVAPVARQGRLPLRDPEFIRAVVRLGWARSGGILFPQVAWAAAIAAGVFVGLVWALSQGASAYQMAVACLAGGAVGLIGFKRLVMRRAERRMARIKAELPLTIRLVRLLLNSGLAYEMAFRRVAEEGTHVVPELSRELDAVLRRTGTGMPLSQSLSLMQQRLDDVDVSRLVGVLVQLISMGGSIDRSLINLAEDLEKRRESTLRERVNKSSGKMSLIMMLFLFPALLILLGGPAIISLTEGLLDVAS
ncbi:type II secretion system F family protein [Guyparkeria hydrothermalis]|uniref:type II secretion system F family protein n=1 Tax=Guyparkeria hydrothermalis TaxID=923 RepID=UPI002022884F|nr:type II secretion system F family protein [Guyparkeria hydrothermalis]MCL7743709.1 type II secretion system F family protein [Guyparkeria hydrothermalis]